MTYDKMTFALARRRKRIKQEDLSVITGISVMGISRIETGKADGISLSTARKLADGIGYKLTDIYWPVNIVDAPQSLGLKYLMPTGTS